MCGKFGQKELALLTGKGDRSSGHGESLPKIEENMGQTDIWSTEEVCDQYFLSVRTFITN